MIRVTGNSFSVLFRRFDRLWSLLTERLFILHYLLKGNYYRIMYPTEIDERKCYVNQLTNLRPVQWWPSSLRISSEIFSWHGFRRYGKWKGNKVSFFKKKVWIGYYSRSEKNYFPYERRKPAWNSLWTVKTEILHTNLFSCFSKLFLFVRGEYWLLK